jgi:L-lactate dehydrogenase complex protein LldG
MQSSASSSTPLATTALWETFNTKAAALGATVHAVASEVEAAGLVLAAAPSAIATGGLVQRFPSIGARFGRLEDSWRADPPQEVAGVAELGVAETGSLLVNAPNSDRGASMLAERLWLLVRAEDLVPTLDAALARVSDLVGGGAPYVTIMSGPSRTADIERTLTIGVHGPRELAIVVIGTTFPDGARP